MHVLVKIGLQFIVEQAELSREFFKIVSYHCIQVLSELSLQVVECVLRPRNAVGGPLMPSCVSIRSGFALR